MGTDFFQDRARPSRARSARQPRPLLLYAAKAARTPYTVAAAARRGQPGRAAEPGGAGGPGHHPGTANDTLFRPGDGTTAPRPSPPPRSTWTSRRGRRGRPRSPRRRRRHVQLHRRGAHRATLATTGLADGRHTLFLRGRDAAGAWGRSCRRSSAVQDPQSRPTSPAPSPRRALASPSPRPSPRASTPPPPTRPTAATT